MITNLKRKDFLEADKQLATTVLSGLYMDRKSAHLIEPFKEWLDDLDWQLENYDN